MLEAVGFQIRDYEAADGRRQGAEADFSVEGEVVRPDRGELDVRFGAAIEFE